MRTTTRSDADGAGRGRRGPTSRRTRLLAAIVVLTTAASAFAVAAAGRAPGGAAGAAPPSLVRWDSHRLTEGPAGATVGQPVQLVEFIDFECRRCRATQPFIDELRADYAGRVDFVVRYFPLPGHANSTHAAIAVEAAARQDAFAEMADVMWATHGHWGRSSEPQTSLFRSFAAELGLDMAAYDAAVADPATAARVRQDFEDGVALGVTGTPTHFLDGVLVRPADEADFRRLLDAALAP
ncbi:disulfide bond formation protein DsbA [Streptomyces sp. NP160]|uniref:DsbA family protein n=1 Tax=Streptomyces sp. NP160 TaxID=2586637 RepID=UPI00111AD466|nr:thioredoxin domain-containing protein [Streptomyces sp. NP160]TNM59316.1 disulfide bond formation protein DsbA [Streptomyces sp. NP160]